jgi:Cu(I)/Ag(I) efflux system membrane protein CusA/SilA
MLAGLLPLLWATGSGADVMKRIAAPMVGGLVTSAFLTLEIIPVVYTYWRREQLLWERLAALDPPLRATLGRWAAVQRWGWGALAGVVAATAWVALPGWALGLLGAGAAAAIGAGATGYLRHRPPAMRLVWPDARPAA